MKPTMILLMQQIFVIGCLTLNKIQIIADLKKKKKLVQKERERERVRERADNSPFSKENVRSSVFPSNMSHCLRNDALIQ